MSRGSRLGRLIVLALALLLAPSGADCVAGDPALEVERDSGRTSVWVTVELADGGTARTLLRETDATVDPRATGSDPAGRAAFATWDESGSGRWFAYSRDGGASWSRARRLETDLRLRDGAVMPGASMPQAPRDLSLPPGGKLFIAQFRTVGLPEWREALASIGAEVLAHVPHNAHVVRMNPGLVPVALGLDFVERVEPYHPWYRIDPRLRDWLNEPEPAAATRRVNVMAFEWGESGKNRIAEAARSSGAAVVASWPSGHIVEIEATRDQLRALAAHDDVMWIDPWSAPETDMDLVREDAGTNFVEDNFGYCGQGVRGEVLDNGIQEDHMDFDGILLHGSHDTQSHGTSTFGIVFGNGDRDGDGDVKGTGHMPCPEAQGIFADYGSVGDRFAHTQELKNDPYFASFQSNSWGSSQVQSYTSASHEMDDIIWRLDIAITQSQSNTGNRNSRPQAWAKNIIAVGGIRHYDTLDTSDDAWANGASIGPAADGRIKPDVSYWYDNIYTTTTGNGYTSGFGGTSAATPETAGTLGLIVQMWADNVWETDPEGSTVFEKQPHFSTIKALLVNTAQQYEFTGQGHDLTRVHQGWGRPSARVAKEKATNSFVVDEEVVLELGDFSIFDVDVQPGESELKVTMVYPDPPGTTSASMHRINDVNLKATSPSGTIYHGNNGLLDGNYSTPGGDPNELDTVENVFVQNPEAGMWKVEIDAPEINQDGYLDTPDDDVTYALVITGGTSRLIQPSSGRVRLDRDFYGCDHRVKIRVIDGNVGASSVTVEIRSDTESDPEVLTLAETKPDSGKYAGEIWTTAGAPASGDGFLSVSHGDVVRVEYVDVDDGEGGTNLLRVDDASADCRAPAITGVAEENVTDARATVVWTTDEMASSEVVWGETVPPTTSETGFGRTTSHSIDLTGLAECTVYYYEVRSEDAYANLAVDDDGGSYHHFETFGDFGAGLQPCHQGVVSVEPSVTSCTGSLGIEVIDLDLNTSPTAAETTTVTVSSTTESTPEVVTLTETGPNTSAFAGSIATAPGAAVEGDGVLQTAHADVLTATYRDADDGTGAATFAFASGDADCEGAGVTSIRVQGETDESVDVRVVTSEPTTVVVDWGVTEALGSVASSGTLQSTHTLTLGLLEECGPVFFRVTTTDAHGNVSVFDAGGAPFRADAQEIPGALIKDEFASDAGWTLEGEWEIGAPQGLGTSPGDPTEPYASTGVLGHDLSGQGSTPGNYERGTSERAISPAIDASSVANSEIKFRRWLNAGFGAISQVEVLDGGSWIAVWSSTNAGVTESSWSLQTIDVSQYADGNASFQFAFRQRGGLQQTSSDAGWNVDRFVFRDGSLPDFAACGGCAGAPTFGGVASAVDADPCADTGIALSWNEAPAWGTGSGGTYAVYRDTDPDFVPSGANLVASGVAATSWTDPAAANDVALYYVVRAENDETCSSGPNNGGLTDDNLVRLPARDETSQPVPGDVGESLRVDPVNDAHTRLTWDPATDAARYHVYRSTSPSGTFDRIAEVGGTVFDDRDQMGLGSDAYYRVRAADACGNETN